MPLKNKTQTMVLSPCSGRIGEGGLRTKGIVKQSYEHNPLVSIINIVLNGEKHIESVIKSVIEQTYDNIEYIIIDGGSKNSTLNIIKKYEKKIDYWVSEPDNGIYDAMNKGIAVAKGDWILFLGSNDCIYAPDTLYAVFNNFNSKCKLIFGNIIYKDKTLYKSRFNKMMFVKNVLHHQSAFYNKKLFNGYKFNTTYKILSDYEFNLKVYQSNIDSIKIDKIITNCGKDGISNRVLFSGYKEEINIRNQFVNNSILLLILNIQTIARYFIKKFLFFFR